MTGHAEQLTRTVSAISWAPGGAPEQRAAFMREYLRRMALWSDWLESHGKDSGPWPFFDVAGAVDETVRWALRFAGLRDSGLPLPDIADPYEPLLRLYADGGGFTLLGNGMIELVPGHAITRGARSDYVG